MSPNAGEDGGLRGLSQWGQLYTEAQLNFGDLTSYLPYAAGPLMDAKFKSKTHL
jgi:hypothetical protein